MHRHDGGNFFPGTGSPEETGSKLFNNISHKEFSLCHKLLFLVPIFLPLKSETLDISNYQLFRSNSLSLKYDRS